MHRALLRLGERPGVLPRALRAGCRGSGGTVSDTEGLPIPAPGGPATGFEPVLDSDAGSEGESQLTEDEHLVRRAGPGGQRPFVSLVRLLVRHHRLRLPGPRGRGPGGHGCWPPPTGAWTCTGQRVARSSVRKEAHGPQHRLGPIGGCLPARVSYAPVERHTEAVLPAIRIPHSEYFGRPRSAFRTGAPARPLEVWVDVESLAPSVDLSHLLDLAEDDQLDVYSTKPVLGGHLTTLILHEGQAGARVDRKDGSFSLHGGSPVDTYSRLTTRWEAGLPEEEKHALLSSALLATVAETSHADASVTGARPVLTKMRRVNAMGVLEALALIGLHFRSADNFRIAKSLRYNRGLYYWLLARARPGLGPLLATSYSRRQRHRRLSQRPTACPDHPSGSGAPRTRSGSSGAEAPTE